MSTDCNQPVTKLSNPSFKLETAKLEDVTMLLVVPLLPIAACVVGLCVLSGALTINYLFPRDKS